MLLRTALERSEPPQPQILSAPIPSDKYSKTMWPASTGSGSGSSSVSITGSGPVSGVRLSGGRVWIDGVEIPEGVARYTAADGRRYRIRRVDGRAEVTGD